MRNRYQCYDDELHILPQALGGRPPGRSAGRGPEPGNRQLFNQSVDLVKGGYSHRGMGFQDTPSGVGMRDNSTGPPYPSAKSTPALSAPSTAVTPWASSSTALPGRSSNGPSKSPANAARRRPLFTPPGSATAGSGAAGTTGVRVSGAIPLLTITGTRTFQVGDADRNWCPQHVCRMRGDCTPNHHAVVTIPAILQRSGYGYDRPNC
jgi:hypothetical protein